MLLELSHFTNSKGTKTERNRFSDDKFIEDDFLHSRRIQKVTEMIIEMTITSEFLGGFKLWLRLFYPWILFCYSFNRSTKKWLQTCSFLLYTGFGKKN